MLNKEQAAAALGITVRTLQRHMAAHRIGFAMRRTVTGEEATFSETEVARFKAERDALTTTVTSATTVSEVVRDAPTQALQRAPSEQGMQALAPHIADALHVALSARIAVPAPSLLLTIPEAAAWLGVSKYQIEIAVHDGKLIAPKIGRGRRVRPEDLLRLKDKLFATAAKEQKLLGDGKE